MLENCSRSGTGTRLFTPCYCPHPVFSYSQQLLPADSVLLPVNNFGANYLQLSVCSKDVNAAKLNHFGQVGQNWRFLRWFRALSSHELPERELTQIVPRPHVQAHM